MIPQKKKPEVSKANIVGPKKVLEKVLMFPFYYYTTG